MTDYNTDDEKADDAPPAKDPYWSDDQFRATGRYRY